MVLRRSSLFSSFFFRAASTLRLFFFDRGPYRFVVVVILLLVLLLDGRFVFVLFFAFLSDYVPLNILYRSSILKMRILSKVTLSFRFYWYSYSLLDSKYDVNRVSSTRLQILPHFRIIIFLNYIYTKESYRLFF